MIAPALLVRKNIAPPVGSVAPTICQLELENRLKFRRCCRLQYCSLWMLSFLIINIMELWCYHNIKLMYHILSARINIITAQSYQHSIAFHLHHMTSNIIDIGFIRKLQIYIFNQYHQNQHSINETKQIWSTICMVCFFISHIFYHRLGEVSTR